VKDKAKTLLAKHLSEDEEENGTVIDPYANPDNGIKANMNIKIPGISTEGGNTSTDSDSKEDDPNDFWLFENEVFYYLLTY
jgi:hypothetical protein